MHPLHITPAHARPDVRSGHPSATRSRLGPERRPGRRRPSRPLLARTTACAVGLAGAATVGLTTPAAAAPGHPAVHPAELAAADAAASEATTAVAEAAAAASDAAAAMDASTAAVATAEDAMVEAHEQVAAAESAVDRAEADRAGAERRAAVASALAGATRAVIDVDVPVVAGAVAAGPVALVGAVGTAMGMLDPVADAATDRANERKRGVVVAEEHERDARRGLNDAVTRQRARAGDLTAAKGAAAEAVQAATRETAETEAIEEASAAAVEHADEMRQSLGVDNRLVRPATGEVSSQFGMRRHPVTGAVKEHSGVDFQIGDGIAYAAAAGTVVSVERDAAYGLIVEVAHGTVDGAAVTTAYAHLAQVDVERGQRIGPAAPLGRIGSTGLSTGPHLHFEVRVAGEPVEPSAWLLS